jgi:heme oxygenase (biliverdin-IX-beta and delta-forming)
MQSPNAIENDSILAQLKSRTANQHQQTEGLVDVMRDDLSLEDYKKLLARFYAFYKSFEPKMSDALRENPMDFDYENRQNTPKLFKDLKSLGMSETEISEIKSFGDLPAIDSKEKIFGALYVVEGSTLGGQVISRHLKEKFGLDETNGSAFFSGYGKETGTMWKNFRDAISNFADGDANREELIGAANETFAKIGKALSVE